jgi:hypothetical protein
MIRLRVFAVLGSCLLLASTTSLRADVKVDEKTKFEFAGALGKVVNIFGGKAAREGTTSAVAVKGSRKSTFNDSTGQIIDLAEEKVYDIDVKRKSYRVMTFAEIRQRMEEAKAKAEKEAREQQAKEAKEKDAEPPAQQAESNVEVDFDVKKTGERKTISGFETQQSVITVTVREKGKTLEQSGGLQVTTDVWLAPQMAAMKEIVDFDIQYAQKLYGPMVAGASPQDMAAAMALYPMMKPALERMAAEASKLEGTAITTVVKVEAVKSAEQLAAEQKQSQEESKPNLSGSVGGLIGGFAKRAAAKKASGGDGPQPRVTVMTTTSEILKIATDVSAGDVALPAGFKPQ